jgi:hypothetical protein
MTIGTVNEWGQRIQYQGIAGVNDNDVVIETGDISHYTMYNLMSTAGAMDVLVTLDGTNYTTAPLSLVDQGAVSATPVIVTAPNRMYGFSGVFLKIRVLQNGATAVANARLLAQRP